MAGFAARIRHPGCFNSAAGLVQRGGAEAAQYLWNSLRYELREQGNCMGIAYDPRDQLADVFQIPFWLPMLRHITWCALPIRWILNVRLIALRGRRFHKLELRR